jgi:hypothetical protein
MKTIFEASVNDFVIKILQGTDKYPNALPALSAQARRVADHHRFVEKKFADSQRKYERSSFDAITKAKEFHTKAINYYNATKHLMTDFDHQEVLNNTCALGLWKTASTDLDAQGKLGLDNNIEYPDDVIEAVIKFYKRYYVAPDVKFKLSMVRGKFIGFPYMISGANRSVNDIFLSVCAALTVGARQKESVDSLKLVYDFLRPYHGEPFAIEGSRTQHTGKEIPMVLTDGIFSSENFNPRYRIINMDPKLSVMDIRKEIKQMLEIIKKTPVHTQNRAEIVGTIKKRTEMGWKIVAIDHSKFDFRYGGKRGRQQIGVHASILGSKKYLSSATMTFDNRFFSYHKTGVFQFPGDAMLKSGMGNTTLVGCTGNFTAFVAALSVTLKRSPQNIVDAFGSEWDALMWGDDCVAMFKDPTWYDHLIKGFTYYKLEATAEATVKYLGSNYERGGFAGSFDKGYSLGRAFQQQFFPEREKQYPFTTVGYIARLDLMGPKGKDFHAAMKPYFTEMNLGTWFDYADRKSVLTKLLPEIQKHSDKISQLDDVLMIFTHGMQDITEADDMIPEEYLDLLGTSMVVDVSDPRKYLADRKAEGLDISDEIIKGVSRLAEGDFDRYKLLATEITSKFKLSWPNGSVFY